MTKIKTIPGIEGVKPEVTSRMLPHKLDLSYNRPTFLDIFAQEAIIISKRSTCLWNEVGAVIFYNGRHSLSSGYNGAAPGDVDPKDAGCARIVDGELKAGQGLCRGTHAELNAIGYLTVSTMNLENVSMMVTLRPCFSCAKQIVSKGIKEVYYLWEYEQDPHVLSYFRERKIKAEKYTSKFLENWIEKNDYTPSRLKKPLNE
jgi:dCMP deaminase